MKRRIVALALALCVLAAGLCCPAALAAESYTARTPVFSADDAKLNNIQLAVQALDGVRVPYGQTFSFNNVVGPRTQDRGYRSAINGRGVKVTGGGVSQVATTLYLALMDVPGSVRFNELSTYGARFTDDYVYDGSLAVVTDYSEGMDFRFTNYADDMLIEMWVGGGYLYCTITVGGDSDSGFTGSWFSSAATPAPNISRVHTASIPFGEDPDVSHNVMLAADSINDTTLGPGDVFSFNRIVGPRTNQYGYISGTNGRGVKVTGGGVSQVASVVWLAVKDMDDIAIVEKSTYGGRYNQHYVSSSADAIVTDYKEDIDFRFRYTGTGTITIYTFVDGYTLRCDVVEN